MIWIVLAIMLALILIPTAFLLQRRMRQTEIAAKLTIQKPRGIVEERYVPIGGIEQWIGIRGEDSDKPRAADPAWRSGLFLFDLHSASPNMGKVLHDHSMGPERWRKDICENGKAQKWPSQF